MVVVPFIVPVAVTVTFVVPRGVPGFFGTPPPPPPPQALVAATDAKARSASAEIQYCAGRRRERSRERRIMSANAPK